MLSRSYCPSGVHSSILQGNSRYGRSPGPVRRRKRQVKIGKKVDFLISAVQITSQNTSDQAAVHHPAICQGMQDIRRICQNPSITVRQYRILEPRYRKSRHQITKPKIFSGSSFSFLPDIPRSDRRQLRRFRSSAHIHRW